MTCAGIVDIGNVELGLSVCLPIVPSPTIMKEEFLQGTPSTTMKNKAGPGATSPVNRSVQTIQEATHQGWRD